MPVAMLTHHADWLPLTVKPDSRLICHLIVTKADVTADDCHIAAMQQHNVTRSSLNLYPNDGLTRAPNAMATTPWPCHRRTSDSITLTSAGAWASLPVLLL